MQLSNCSTLDPTRRRRRTIPFSGLSLHPKNVTAAGQVRCFRRTRSNPQTSRITLPVTVQLQSNRRHLTFRVRINRPPRHQSSAYLSQRHRLAGRTDRRARPSQPFAGYRTHDQGRVQQRQPTGKRLAAAHASDIDSFCRLPIPRQQFIEPIDRMPVDHALEHIMQVRVGLDVVHFGSLNERTERRPARSALIRSSEQMILSPECNRTDRALDRIGVELDTTIVQEPREAMPARQCITDRFGELAAARRVGKLLFQPELQILDERLGERPPFGHSMRRGLTADALLDGIKLTNSPQRLGCNGRAIGLEEFVEVAPRMCPASGQDDIAARLQSLEAGIAVDVQHAGEVLQMRRRAFTLAIRRKHVDGSRRCCSTPRPLVTHIDPEPTCLGATATGIEHRDWRIVGKQRIRRKDIRAQPFVQRVEPPTRAANPSGQRRAIELNPVARKDLRLPVQRRVLAIFADQDLREQGRGCEAACDRTFRRRRLAHCSADAAAVFGAANADDTELRGHPVQHLADALSDLVQRAAAACAGLRADVDPDLFTWQMIRKRLAPRRPVLRSGSRLLRSLGAGFVGLDVLQSKRELVGIDTLGSTAKPRPLKLFDDQLESFDLAVAPLDDRSHVAHKTMQQVRIGRKIIEIELHDESYSNLLIRSSSFAMFDARFCTSSACKSRLPGALRSAPVDAFNQHRKLRWRECHGAARLAQRRPYEATVLQPLGEQTESVPIPKQDLHRVRLLAAERKQVTRERVFLQHLLHQDCEAVEALSHVGATERQMDLHTGGYDQHRAFSSRSATYRRTASGSLPAGAKTRRPSASSTAIAPGGIGSISCRTATSAPASWLPLRCSSAIRTTARLVGLPLPKPSSARHRNSTLVTIRCVRATCDTVAPGCSVSSTIARFCAAVKLRRRLRPDGVGSTVGVVVKMFLICGSLALSLALVLTVGRTLE